MSGRRAQDAAASHGQRSASADGSGRGDGRSASAASTQTNNMQSLLQIVRSHQRSHEDGKYDDSSVQRCRAMLGKVKKMLPKLLRSISTVDADTAVAVLKDMCELLHLLIHARACPHATVIFADEMKQDSSENDQHRGSATSNLGVVTQSFATIATILLHLVSFYCNERLLDAQEQVLDVVVQLVVLLQSRDTYASLHFFRDTLELLEDCLLLEECLRRSPADDDVGAASVACYLNTALHAFHGSDGLLGSSSSKVLCGCATIDDVTAVYNRKEKLKALLPPISVACYGSAIVLRRSITNLVTELLRVNGSQILLDHSVQRLRLLVDPLFARDLEIVATVMNVSVVSGVSKRDKLEVAEATCKLVALLLSMSSGSERSVIQIAEAFFNHTSCYCAIEELAGIIGFVVRHVSDCIRRMSPLGCDEIWPCILQWHSEVMDTDADVLATRSSLLLSLFGLYEAIVEESQGASLSVALELMQLSEGSLQSEEAKVIIVKSIHKFVSVRHRLIAVLQECSKNIPKWQHARAQNKHLGGRKRRRTSDPRIVSRAPVARVRGLCCELLSSYILELVFIRAPDAESERVAMVLALRILLPLRPLADRVARVESQSLIRTIIHRVEEVVQVSESVDCSSLSSSSADLITLLLAHLSEQEVRRFRVFVDNTLSTLRALVKVPSVDGLDFPRISEMADSFSAFREVPGEWTSNTLSTWLVRCDGFINHTFRMHPVLRGLFIAVIVWKHHRALGLRVATVMETAPGQVIKTICKTPALLGATRLAFLSAVPMIFVFVDHEHGEAGSRVRLVRSVIEMLAGACSLPNDDTTSMIHVCLDAIQKSVCFAASRGTTHEEFADWAPSRRSCCAFQASTSSRIVAFNAIGDVLQPLLHWFQIEEKFKIHHERLLPLAVSLLHHVDFSDSRMVEKMLVFELLRATTHQHRLVRRCAMRHLRMCIDLPACETFVVGSEESSALVTQFTDAINDAMKTCDYLLLESCIEAIGTTCCSRSVTGEEGREVLNWGFLKLLFLWIDTHRTQIPVATAVHDQMRRLFARHATSWKTLFETFPEYFYYPVVNKLLRARALLAFARTFFGAYFDEAMIVRDSAPHVLPHYVWGCQEDMMRCFLEAYNGDNLGDGDVSMEDEESVNPYSTTATTMSTVLLANIAPVLKELIMRQFEAGNNENRGKGFDFLFRYLPDKSTMRDVINHSPFRLLMLLAWELGGERYESANKAFREISEFFQSASQGDIDTAVIMPMRYYFLALMTELGHRMGKKASVMYRVRAIKSIQRLFGVFNEQVDVNADTVKGALDPFVPKVMAILKVGLYDKHLEEHSMLAWSTFIRMLTTKALESNFVSIVVSVLPCIRGHAGPSAAFSLQTESGMRPIGVWCLEMISSDSVTVNIGNAQGIAEAPNSATASAAVGIFQYLFVEKRSELKHAFPRIRLIPSVRALDEVYAAYVSEVGDPSARPLSDFLTSCLAYVTHWDSGVRETVLRELYHALVLRAMELRQLMESEGDYIDPSVLEVLFAILQVAKTDRSEAIRLLCAKCLGALGAIDGARIPLSILHSSKTGVTTVKERPETRMEYSTKDLACVLIENWLVKELRAAPENTDAVGFSIQELLMVLADLSADPQHGGQSLNTGVGTRKKTPTNSPMPEWLKRRFERKDVLEFVEPYWYSNYTVKNKKTSLPYSSTTFYERYSSTYEEWLQAWCRRLIDLSQPPERAVFEACEMVLTTSVQVGRFVLPYLIQNVLRSGRPELYGEVKREMMAVLKDDGVMDDLARSASIGQSHSSTNRPDDSNERAFGEYASRHHQCVQTIVSTIDELNEWVWSNEKKRLALSASTSRSSASTPAPSDMDDQEKEYLEEFLKDTPSQVLSSAAFNIKAYARALQYFEVYLRQQQPPKKKESKTTTSTLLATLPVDLTLVSKHATYLQQLYSRVDEPDALTGLATLRRLYDAQLPATERGTAEVEESNSTLADLLHQVVDHEQLAQWEDALACYELAIQEIRSAEANHGFFSGDIMDDEEDAQQGPFIDLNKIRDPRSVKPALYSGIVQCLIQLGRLESALQHINGIVTQEPQFVGTLYPHALECAWRLSRWELVSELLNTEQQTSSLSNSLAQGGISSRLRNLDVSQLSLVRVLHSFHEDKPAAVLKNLREARLEIMGPLAAACAESYQRAYPLLHKLHFLHEAEQGFICLHGSRHDEQEAHETRWKEQCLWDMRYDLLSTSLKFRDPILALRRVMLQEAHLPSQVSHNWLSYAKVARKEGYIRTATSAVMHAEALDNKYATLEKAKLMVAQDRMYEALQILEPVDIDASKIEFKVEDPHYFAKILLLATNWMQESGQRQGRKVVERYEAVIKFDPTWEKGYFYLAKYYEYLLSVSHPEAPTAMTSASNSRHDDAAVNIDSTFHSHLVNLMKNYVLALSHGTKHVFQSMPRLLTLWFEYGELLQPGSNKGTSVNKAMRSIEMELSQTSAEQQILTDIAQIMQDATEMLPAYEWLVCFPQVTSRICHPNQVVVDGVKKIMLKVLVTYPTQAMWPLLGLSRSLNSQRRNRARDIIGATQRHFLSAGLPEVANSYAEGQRLAEELISLAGHDPGNQRKIHIKLSRIRTLILVPVQAGLNTVLPLSGLAPRDDRHVAFMPHSQVHIKSFSDKADVMMTKEKPKRIEVLGTDGKIYPFLCKREKTGDLRKDARMMEFNTMINKLLQKDREGRKRKLRLRTYAVVCLNEESGLMEWVRHTKAMRQLIGQIHKTERGFIQPVRLTHEIKEQFLGMQKKFAGNPTMMALFFRHKILELPVFTPRFHQWFTNNFADPTAWFEARLAFSRSAAVWSMVGHIIGLGDRHGENILIDCTNGECVHVDFDCLFDKGLKLAKPEIVPFRLTPNIIDAFGITGYEGVFRRVCEVTMALLRDNRETLRSVLESFIHDPLVEWGRRGKNAQGMATSSNGRGIADISSDRSKEETRIILKTIDDRLSGIYNLGDAIRPLVSSAHRSLLPENETLPLSVQGQVDKLIHEATAHENLAQMYIGWMPFL